MFGDRVKKDSILGCTWSLKAANQGHARAQNNAGLCFQNGHFGGEPGFAKAFYWFQESANQGQPVGLYNLGLLYEHGEGVQKGKTGGSDITGVIRQLTQIEGGIVVLTASTAEEVCRRSKVAA